MQAPSNDMTFVAAAIDAAVPTMPDLAYNWLRDRVLSGALESGQQIRQEEVAQILGVSRVPVREALRRLEVEGLVAARPRRGYVVASLDPEDIEDIFDIRAMLEERAGYLATLRRTPADVAALERLVAAMDGLVIRDAADVNEFAARNRAFHARLFEPCERPQLIRMMNVLRNSVERYIRIGALVVGNLGRVQKDHWQIMEAFRAGDADAVARLCRKHCEDTCERLVERLRAGRSRKRPNVNS